MSSEGNAAWRQMSRGRDSQYHAGVQQGRIEGMIAAAERLEARARASRWPKPWEQAAIVVRNLIEDERGKR